MYPTEQFNNPLMNLGFVFSRLRQGKKPSIKILYNVPIRLPHRRNTTYIFLKPPSLPMPFSAHCSYCKREVAKALCTKMRPHGLQCAVPCGMQQRLRLHALRMMVVYVKLELLIYLITGFQINFCGCRASSPPVDCIVPPG